MPVKLLIGSDTASYFVLISRNIPACIVRVLIQAYTGQQARVSWVGAFSDYFCVLNCVKQGGVLSPVILCIY